MFNKIKQVGEGIIEVNFFEEGIFAEVWEIVQGNVWENPKLNWRIRTSISFCLIRFVQFVDDAHVYMVKKV